VLAVVRVEDGLRQEVGGAGKGADAAGNRRRQRLGGEGRRLAAVEHREQRVDVRQRGGLVEGDGDRLGVDLAEVHLLVVLWGLGVGV
jgi:hypothetical protein